MHGRFNITTTTAATTITPEIKQWIIYLTLVFYCLQITLGVHGRLADGYITIKKD